LLPLQQIKTIGNIEMSLSGIFEFPLFWHAEQFDLNRLI